MNNWMIYNKDISSLKPLGLSDEILRILANRGIETTEEALAFLKPSLEGLHDPYLMRDMDLAVDLIMDTIEEDGHIHIVGDYDQDGNSATVTLLKGLRHFHERVTYAVPDRVEDGYGLNENMVDNAKAIGVDLILTCDNGISAHDAIRHAKELGMRVLITDHHQVSLDEEGEEILPPADGILNPNRRDCDYPFKELCGAGVAFKLITALFDALGADEEEWLDLLQFVAMGTICDVVDLVDENRILVQEGLRRINRTENLGMRALIELNSWNKPVDVYAVGFVLGPCINASGRLSTARLGIELFMEEDEELVKNYALELIRLNNERKRLTQEAFQDVESKLKSGEVPLTDVLVAYTESGHESIVGIVAGRIKERFYRPTIVFSQAGEAGVLKGSGRSIEEYDMFTKLSEIREFFLSFGGHPMAAGMSIRGEKLDQLREELHANSGLSERDLQRKYTIDIAYPIERLELAFIDNLSILEPFGKGNPKPVFADKGIDLLGYKVMGKNQNVLKLILRKGERVVEAICFSGMERILEYIVRKFGEQRLANYNPRRNQQNPIDLIYYPSINEFRGERTVQLQIIDVR
ncbi:MAG: single-stranded-DNA-specific exonuclease RecJ [Tissierellia bacterium]|nr:single-stranded-DNA-specific exonuclease RecJ [Tissierellia bacterium]